MEEPRVQAQTAIGRAAHEEMSRVPVLAGETMSDPSTGERSVWHGPFSKQGKSLSDPVQAGGLVGPGGSVAHAATVKDVVVDSRAVSPPEPNFASKGGSPEPKSSDLPADCQDDGNDVESCSMLYNILKLKTVVNDNFRSLCREASSFAPSVLQLGISTLQLLLMTPRDGKWIKFWLEASLHEQGVSTSPNRGIFPMCLPPVGAAVQLLKRLPKSATGLIKTEITGGPLKHTKKRQQTKKLIEEGCKQLWRMIIVSILTGSSCW